jgi:hypothetical protein
VPVGAVTYGIASIHALALLSPPAESCRADSGPARTGVV